MKLAFSTLGCPGWSWDEIFATAKDLSFDGIEVRGVGDEIYAPNATPFNTTNIKQTVNQLNKTNMQIPILTTSICVSNGNEAEIIKEANEYINLAEKLSAKYFRVMGTGTPQPESKIDLKKTTKLYSQICDIAAEKGISPLIETNGIFAETNFLAEFIRNVNKSNSGVLWDIHHPFRFFNESPAQTVKNLDGMIKYVHVKDSIIKDGTVIYRMMGYGDVPVLDALKELKAEGYNDFVSLEWVKRWNPDLSEPGIVFPHFINYMEFLFKQL
jgi:sugar phosphate isomerase/epimerase